MKLLTFLGLGKYEPTIYLWDGQECQSRFAPIASCRFLQADEIIVFLTEKVQIEIFPDFTGEVPAGVRLTAVPIPLGRSEQELWQIFDAVRCQVQPGEQVAFDVTHGMRSSPILSILAAAFLQSAFDVKLKAVFYGAYVDHSENGEITRTPIFDLSPLIKLLEWAAAADRFNRTGDSRYLASLIRAQKKELAMAAGKDRAMLDQAASLGSLAGALTEISQALHLIRPYHSMRKIAALPERVENARSALEYSAASLPFSVLLQSILDAYAPLAQTHPEREEEVWVTLQTERKMIAWYIERELWVQAVSLAREWLVSWVMVRRGNPHVEQLNARSITERVLGSESDEFVKAKKAGQEYQPAFLAGIPNIETVLSLWPNLTKVRNDIDHAGKREDPRGPEELIGQIQQIYQQLLTLPLEH